VGCFMLFDLDIGSGLPVTAQHSSRLTIQLLRCSSTSPSLQHGQGSSQGLVSVGLVATAAQPNPVFVDGGCVANTWLVAHLKGMLGPQVISMGVWRLIRTRLCCEGANHGSFFPHQRPCTPISCWV